MPTNPYQVATTRDPTLPHRKWQHLGTHHAISHRTAAWQAHKGNIVGESNGQHGVIFQFACGLYACVGFGSAPL